MTEKKILAILDPTNRGDQPVIERAAWLAERLDASLEFYVCDFDWQVDQGYVSAVWVRKPDAKDHLIELHRERAEKLAAPLRERGLEVTVDVDWDHPLDKALARKILKVGPMMVAKDTHYHGVLNRTNLSSTDWYLIRGCPCPLWLVKARPPGPRPRVLAAVDPTHSHDKPGALDDEIYWQARKLTDAIQGILHLIHCHYIPIEFEMPPKLRESIVAEHRSALAAFVRDHPCDRQYTHLVDGITEYRLPEFAEKVGAAVTVMGAVSRRRLLERVFIGSTAEKVLDRMPCDVLIVKT